MKITISGTVSDNNIYNFIDYVMIDINSRIMAMNRNRRLSTIQLLDVSRIQFESQKQNAFGSIVCFSQFENPMIITDNNILVVQIDLFSATFASVTIDSKSTVVENVIAAIISENW